MKLLTNLPKYYKAAAAFISLLVPFLTAIGTSLSDGEIAGSELTAIMTAGTALVVGTTAVYQVKNKK